MGCSPARFNLKLRTKNKVQKHAKRSSKIPAPPILPEELRRGNEQPHTGLMHWHTKPDEALEDIARLRTGFPDAYPLTVSVTAMNAAEELLTIYEDPLDALKTSVDGNEAYWARIDMCDPVEGTQWPGHLVVIVPMYDGQQHTMLDITVKQLNSPKKGVVFHPLNVPVRETFDVMLE